MKAIIIGAGSIGKRHSANLNSLGVETRLVDIEEIGKISEILNQEKFDLGLVCTPTSFHLEHSLKLAENGIPIFCEKPFYFTRDDKLVKKLLSLVKEKKLPNMVGCNLRFTQEVDNISNQSKYINAYFGFDLRKWRPNTNHLESYSANKELGGGILLDAIHEIDYLYYKFGKIKTFQAQKLKISNVTKDTEDLVNGRIVFSNGTIADYHLNYLSDEYTRFYELLDPESGKFIKTKFEITNEMYLKEIKYFLNCLENKEACMNSFEEADYLLKIVS